MYLILALPALIYVVAAGMGGLQRARKLKERLQISSVAGWALDSPAIPLTCIPALWLLSGDFPEAGWRPSEDTGYAVVGGVTLAAVLLLVFASSWRVVSLRPYADIAALALALGLFRGAWQGVLLVAAALLVLQGYELRIYRKWSQPEEAGRPRKREKLTAETGAAAEEYFRGSCLGGMTAGALVAFALGLKWLAGDVAVEYQKPALIASQGLAVVGLAASAAAICGRGFAFLPRPLTGLWEWAFRWTTGYPFPFP